MSTVSSKIETSDALILPSVGIILSLVDLLPLLLLYPTPKRHTPVLVASFFFLKRMLKFGRGGGLFARYWNGLVVPD